MALFEYPPRVLVEFEPDEAETLLSGEAGDPAIRDRALDRVRKALAVEKGPGGSLYRAEVATPADEL